MALTKIKSSNILDGSIASEDLGTGVGGSSRITDNSTGINVTGDVTNNGLNTTVTSDSDSIIKIVSSATSNNTEFRIGTDGNDSVISGTGGANGALAFKVYGIERLRINSSGNVGVGTSDPQQKLHVVGKIKVTDDIQLSQTTPRLDYDGGSSSGGLRFWSTSGNVERMRITSAGLLGVGTLDPKRRAHIKGDSVNNSGWVTEHYDGGREYKNFYANKSHTSGNAYHHLKTSIKTGDYIMYRLDLKGYNYGISAMLDHTCVGYAYTSGQNISTANYVNGGAGSSSTYVSSDGYIVLKTHLGTNGYYSGFQVSAKFEQPTGNSHVLTTLAHTFTSSSSNQY